MLFRSLDLGFADEVDRLLAALPARRQTLLFSATLPAAVQALAGQLLRSPLQVALTSDPVRWPDAPADAADAGEAEGAADAAKPAAATALPLAITQRAIEVHSTRRTPLLRHLMASEGWDRVLVFVATQYASEHVADKLKRAGHPGHAADLAAGYAAD